MFRDIHHQKSNFPKPRVTKSGMKRAMARNVMRRVRRLFPIVVNDQILIERCHYFLVSGCGFRVSVDQRFLLQVSGAPEIERQKRGGTGLHGMRYPWGMVDRLSQFPEGPILFLLKP